MSATWNDVMLGNYGSPRIEIASGEGCYVTDTAGKKYLDLVAGIAVSSLGHAHPAFVKAVSEQVATIAHTSNLYSHPGVIKLAARLLALADMKGKVFFSQDGATANEAALKLARLWGSANGRTKFVAMNNSFHGRTMGALSLTGNPAKRDAFAPFGIAVDFVDFGDIAALEAAVTKETVAIFVEPIQGEAGVVVPSADYLSQVRAVANQYGCLMIVDEVQSGIGRTGEWFASSVIKPDIITLAKGLAGGLPLGAMLVSEPLTNVFKPGDHGTTFGGNPVSCAAALAVLETIESHSVLHHVQQVGVWLRDAITALRLPEIVEVRGSGLWLAVVFASDIASSFEVNAREAGFIVNAVRPNVIRLAPPLVITQSELQTFVDALPGLVNAR